MSIDALQQKVWGLVEKLLPYNAYRYLVFRWKKVKLCGKEYPYQEEFFAKYRPFSRKTYCVIRIDATAHALFTAAKRYIFAAEYARSKGMYPIMDLEFYSEFPKGVLKGDNLWEDVFYQKKNRDILNENATIIVTGIDEGAGWSSTMTCMDVNGNPSDPNIHVKEENWRSYYKNIYKYVRKNLKFNQLIINEVGLKYIELLQGGKSVLGIAMREMFSQEFFDQLCRFNARKALKWHPAGPNVAEILDIVAEYMEKWKCSKIFVGTIYSDTIERFEERFPGKILYLQRERVTMLDDINRINSRRHFYDRTQVNRLSKADKEKQHKYTKEYAQETLLLSKCDYFIGAVSAQSAMALSINGGRYKDIKVLEDRNHIERY